MVPFQIAKKCYEMRNYNSLSAVLAGLLCTPIYRLGKTWREVPSKRRRYYYYTYTSMKIISLNERGCRDGKLVVTRHCLSGSGSNMTL